MTSSQSGFEFVHHGQTSPFEQSQPINLDLTTCSHPQTAHSTIARPPHHLQRQTKVPRQTPPRLTVPLPISSYMPLKSAEAVFTKYKDYITEQCVGRLATKLARNTYFGEDVLIGSSISGTEDTRPLDPKILEKMKLALQEKFPEASPTAFEMIWAKCVESI